MRRWLYVQLDAAGWSRSGMSPANRAVASAIILAVLVSVLETEPELMAPAAGLFNVADILFGLLFSIEYALRLWIAGENPKYGGVLGRLKYALSPVALVDLFAVLPFWLTVGIQDAFLLRLVRLLRLFTLAKLGRYSTALQNIGSAILARRHELVMSLLAAFVVMLLAASALHFTEGSRNPESFGSIPRALWWGAATVTKVGYGGAFPVTVLGKVFAVIFAIAAVGVVAMPTGILAASFSNAFQREQERRGLTAKDD